MLRSFSVGYLLAGLVVAFSGASCTKKDTDGSLKVYHVSYPHKDDVKTWDPANAYDSISLDVVPSIYETLYQYSYLRDTYTVEPLLAADMPRYSADRLTLTIPIKHGVMFQDDPCFPNGKGRELKAQDFVYEIKRLALPSLQSQGYWVVDGKLKGINDFHDKLLKAAKSDLPKVMNEDVEGIRALDDYTLQMKLIKPYPQLMYVMVMSFTSPVAHEQVEKYGDENGNLQDHPVGTGPFVLTEWDHGRKIILDRNPTHRAEFYPTDGSPSLRDQNMLVDAGKPMPFVDRIVVDVIKEEQPMWLSFLNGKDDTTLVAKDEFPKAIVNQVNLAPELASKGIRLNIESGVQFYYISFNMKDKLIGGNKFLRQALSSAIDRTDWINVFTNGTGKKAVSALPPGIPDRPKTDKIKYDFNLAEAKALLKKAGYPDGNGLPTINFDLRGADSTSRQIGDFFTRQWAAIGVKVNVILNTFPAYLQKAKDGNLQVSYGGWSMDYPDGENVYQLVYGPNKAPGPNDSNYDNPVMNKLYEQMAIMESGPKRAAIVQTMDDLLQEDCPWAMGFYNTNYYVTQPWVQNFRSNDIILNKYKYVRIDKEAKARYQK